MSKQHSKLMYSFVKPKGTGKHLYQELKEKKINSIFFGYREFEIHLAENLQYKDETKLDGLTEFNDYKLYLDLSLNDARARETMLHEIFHCILDLVEIDERSSSKLEVTNEILTSCLTRGFLLFKRLNPDLAELLY